MQPSNTFHNSVHYAVGLQLVIAVYFSYHFYVSKDKYTKYMQNACQLLAVI